MNDDADLIGVERTDDRKTVSDALTASPSFDFADRLDHFSTEYNAFRSGLRDSISTAVVGEIACRHAVADDDESTILTDPDVLVAVWSAGLQKIRIVGSGYVVHGFKPIAIDHRFYPLKVGDRLNLL